MLVKAFRDVSCFIAVDLAGSVFVFVGSEAKLVNGSDGGFEDTATGYAVLHFRDVLGVEHHDGDGGRGEVVVNGYALFDEGEGFAGACDRVDDEMGGGLVDEVDAGELFGCAVGRERGGRGKGQV